MQLLSTLKTLSGVGLVAAAMVLSLPGIQVVRAEEAVADASAPGPMCSVEDADRAREFTAMKEIEARLAELRAEQEREWAEKGWGPKEAAEAGEAVVLNGRGYNYRPVNAPQR